ncbi:VOC family protein [Nocardia jiangxiensis]|uniref:VOC family protein n=1 Tax=Nocardia jiangxiensis TaxID=282685 RepID=A0ABW6SEX4_9NOCA
MRVSAIDHVNIVADDLEGTCTFYEQLLGLTTTTSAGQSIGYSSAWLTDTEGNALIHVLWNDPSKQTPQGHTSGGTTGAIHHIALRCNDFEQTRRIADYPDRATSYDTPAIPARKDGQPHQPARA